MKLFSALWRHGPTHDGAASRAAPASDLLEVDAAARLIMTEATADRILMARRLAAADLDEMDELGAMADDAACEAFDYGLEAETIGESETEAVDR